jgi:hypothetical protein
MRFGAAMTGALAGLQCLVAFSAFAEADQTHPETAWPTTSWMVSTAEEQGLDSGSLARLVETVGARKQDSLLVIRHGKIVAEAYYAPYAAAVMSGIMGDDEYYPTARLIDDIAGAVKSDKPLPPDAVAQSLLAASIRDAATERPSPLGETPGLAKAISGKLYRFGDNELHVKTFSLNLVDAPASWEITTKESDEPSERFAGLLGLEGVFQLSPRASYGINAVKGRWLNAHTFSIERRILGHGETQFWALAFDGKTVDVSFVSTDGLKIELRGETAD